MKWIDLPPVWLLLGLLAAWFLPWAPPWGPLLIPGYLCLFLAAVLAVSALIEFRRVQTTFIPHKTPSALITSGIFRYSRNPIYLADLLILLGFSLIWGRLVGLMLLPVLWAVLELRFILPEESRLSEAFPDDFKAYSEKVRRWI